MLFAELFHEKRKLSNAREKYCQPKVDRLERQLRLCYRFFYRFFRPSCSMQEGANKNPA